jgi:hypothetical protein
MMGRDRVVRVLLVPVQRVPDQLLEGARVDWRPVVADLNWDCASARCASEVHARNGQITPSGGQGRR